MIVGLLPFDSKIPNLALMKLSTYHKAKGDSVALFDRLNDKPDVVYVSVVFSWSRHSASGFQKLFPDIKFIYGGSACNYKSLPDSVEHLTPDYELYPTDFSIGFTSRGCLRKCQFCLVPLKEGAIREHSPLSEFVRHDKVMLLDNNFLASSNWKEKLKELKDRNVKVDFNQGLDIRLLVDDKHKEAAGLLADLQYYGYPKWNKKTLRFAFDNPKDRKIVEQGIKLLTDAGVRADSLQFYVLSGFNTTIGEDVERVNILKELGARPFIMIYRNPTSTTDNRSAEQKKLQHWVNHIPYYEVFSYDEFNPTIKFPDVQSHDAYLDHLNQIQYDSERSRILKEVPPY